MVGGAEAATFGAKRPAGRLVQQKLVFPVSRISRALTA